MTATGKQLEELAQARGEVARLRQVEIALKERVAALTREEHLLRTLLDVVPDHIYFKDERSRFIRVSKAMAAWFKLSDPRQVEGKTDADIFSEEHASRALADEQAIMRTGQPLVGVEEKETWPGGDETWVSTTKVPLRDSAGTIVGTCGISRDITQQKRVEAEREQLLSDLQRAAERIRRLQGLVPMCAACKRVRDDKGYWRQVEAYISECAGVAVSHGLCEECASKLYPRLASTPKPGEEGTAA